MLGIRWRGDETGPMMQFQRVEPYEGTGKALEFTTRSQQMLNVGQIYVHTWSFSGIGVVTEYNVRIL